MAVATLTKEQAIQKLKQFCLYQERCHFDVKQKLFLLKIPYHLHGEIIAALIEDDCLNEERFACLYAGGKFRIKGWGRKKIIQKLREKQVSQYVVNAAMKEISEEDYMKSLAAEAEKKYASLREEQYLNRKKKTIDYLQQKGYELELINSTLQSIVQNKQR